MAIEKDYLRVLKRIADALETQTKELKEIRELISEGDELDPDEPVADSDMPIQGAEIGREYNRSLYKRIYGKEKVKHG